MDEKPAPQPQSQPQQNERKDPPKTSNDKQTVRKLSDNKSQRSGLKQFTNSNRRSSIKDEDSATGKKQTTADEQKPSGDKKISRYSERRNRAKEKREAGSTGGGAGEEQLEKLSLAEDRDDGDARKEDEPADRTKQNWSEGDDKPFQHIEEN